MVRLTHSMQACLDKIKQEVCSLYESSAENLKTIVLKPTKKKEFKAVVINLGKPSFQFYINDRFFGTYFFDSKTNKWNFVQ